MVVVRLTELEPLLRLMAIGGDVHLLTGRGHSPDMRRWYRLRIVGQLGPLCDSIREACLRHPWVIEHGLPDRPETFPAGCDG